ncbi:MAG TPA: tRNA (adenosine(37)-N6)-threonylcarbamoyltransferase complex dimerization subunit type 1 TsaB [Casimicrobiaceae bacterium]|nr:tRNA (adenosine(37)-N6)-threonylcarbamoyltransferase complex dimerization subunit type 1 TsaB [Casimicrobiaceae bacterium]
MRIVAIDSSTDWLSVCASDGSSTVAFRERAGTASSERMLPLVRQALAEAGWTLAGLGGIAYGAGPGSFTGIRIACGVAQGLALGADLPVVGVPTLHAVAHACWREHGAQRVLACLDARMREIYVASYVRESGGWRLASGPTVCKPDALEMPDPGPWHGAGDAFAAYPALAAGPGLAAVDPAIVPDATSIAELAAPRFAAGEGLPADQAQPLYVRHRVALTTVERAAGLRL